MVVSVSAQQAGGGGTEPRDRPRRATREHAVDAARSTGFPDDVDALDQRFRALEDAARRGDPGQLDAVLGELGIALEELTVAAAELQAQNEELVRAQREQEEAQRRYRDLFQLAPDGYVVTDSEGVISEVNAAAEKVLNASDHQLHGHPLVVFVDPPDRRALHRLISTVAAVENVVEKELVFRQPSGSTIPVWVRVVGGADGMIRWMLRDITRQKELEAALRETARVTLKQSETLAELDTMRDLFLRALSHDLQGPVYTIGALADALASRIASVSTGPDTDVQRAINGVRDNVAQIERLRRDVLDIDRLRGGVMTLNRRHVDLAALIQRVVDAADLCGREVQVHAAGVAAEIDPGLVERIVHNLVVNAVEYTPRATPIIVGALRESAGVLITVDDRGPGIPEAERNAVFEAFRSGTSVGTAIEGRSARRSFGARMGVGLHLVARFTELHGGRAWVEEREGGGASFRVLLPNRAEASRRRG